ncbi:MAG: c-type cytochrome, partial [Anaerolineales bacterium]|nr:c-type cytochrome [Anaerolineales bacterium]
PCHGPAGAGGGSMAAQLPTTPPDMSDPEFVRARTPLGLFTAISAGNIDALMPPFKDSLSEAERWSLVAFLYTLSTPPQQLETGRAVYTAQCAQCHGEGGQGDGPAAAGLEVPLPDFTNQASMVGRSQQEFFALVSGGDALHPFAESLTDSQRWAALDAVRAFAYAYAPPGDLLAERSGEVTGRVVNGTAGAAVPAGLEINLHGFDSQSLVESLTTTVKTDGAFVFDSVAYVPGRQFVMTTIYEDVTYSSEVASFDAQGRPLSLSLPIYETTSDASVLTVEQMHMFLEFLNPGEVTVGQLYIFSNASDKTFTASGGDLLQFNLPAEATGLDVQNAVLDQDYFRNADGFGMLWQVTPGAGTSQVLFSFRLPYDGALSFSQVMHASVNNVNVLVSDLGVELSGPSLVSLGTQTFEAQSFQNFSAASLAAGETLAFTLTGTAGTAGNPGSGGAALAPSSSVSLAVGLGALAVALLGIGIWLYRRPVRLGPAARREELLDALAELDDAYAAGELDQADYIAERSDLKAELRAIWDEQG